MAWFLQVLADYLKVRSHDETVLTAPSLGKKCEFWVMKKESRRFRKNHDTMPVSPQPLCTGRRNSQGAPQPAQVCLCNASQDLDILVPEVLKQLKALRIEAIVFLIFSEMSKLIFILISPP